MVQAQNCNEVDKGNGKGGKGTGGNNLPGQVRAQQDENDSSLDKKDRCDQRIAWQNEQDGPGDNGAGDQLDGVSGSQGLKQGNEIS
jgi:hypothetical protein